MIPPHSSVCALTNQPPTPIGVRDCAQTNDLRTAHGESACLARNASNASSKINRHRRSLMPAQLRVTTDSSAQPPVAASNASAPGISTLEAQRLLALDGPNALPDVSSDPWRAALAKFWAPVPWMLEAAIVLELVLGKFVESALIGALLVFNAALGAIQERRAQSTLASLRSRLALRASVFRDGDWMLVAAETVVLGDRIKLSLGGVVPADALVVDGHILADQSMLTGESLPVDLHAGSQTWAGSLVRGGEAIATVTATGANTKFGRTERSFNPRMSSAHSKKP